MNGAILYGAERPDVSAGSPGETAVGEGVSEAGSGGIADALPKVCNRLEAAYRERFYEQIVTVEN